MKFITKSLKLFCVTLVLLQFGVSSIVAAEIISASAKKLAKGTHRVTVTYNYDASNKNDIIHNIEVFAGGQLVCQIINSIKPTLFRSGPHTYATTCKRVPSYSTKFELRARTLGLSFGGKRSAIIRIN